MKIGEKINLLIKKDDDNHWAEYRCTIIGMDDQYIFIDDPINKDTQRTGFFPIGTTLLVTYVDKDDILYQFQTMICKRITLTIPGLAVDRPNKEDIKQIQRREYVRVRAAIDIAIHPTDEEFIPFTTITNDISGGGVAIVSPPNITFNKGQILSLWLALHVKSGITYVHLQGEVVHMNRLKNNLQTASIKFISITDQMRQNIIKFVFEKQRDARKKELI